MKEKAWYYSECGESRIKLTVMDHISVSLEHQHVMKSGEAVITHQWPNSLSLDMSIRVNGCDYKLGKLKVEVDRQEWLGFCPTVQLICNSYKEGVFACSFTERIYGCSTLITNACRSESQFVQHKETLNIWYLEVW